VTKFNDLDHDGVQDPFEPGLAGWTINLSDPNMNLTQIVTNSGGTTCTGIQAGLQYVAFETLQIGWTQSFPAPSGAHNLFIECGQLINISFGNFQNGVSTPTSTRTNTATPTNTPTRTHTPNINPPD